MGKCIICKQELLNPEDIDFIELSPRNVLDEITSGMAVHKQCKAEAEAEAEAKEKSLDIEDCKELETWGNE